MSKQAEIDSWVHIAIVNESALVDFLQGSLGMPRSLSDEFIKRLSLYIDARCKVELLRKSKARNPK